MVRGLEFRSTKDLDIVLVAEALTSAFFVTFWDFVRDGKYEHLQGSTGKSTFYRFVKPGNPEYPYMLELFSRVPNAFSVPLCDMEKQHGIFYCRLARCLIQ